MHALNSYFIMKIMSEIIKKFIVRNRHFTCGKKNTKMHCYLTSIVKVEWISFLQWNDNYYKYKKKHETSVKIWIPSGIRTNFLSSLLSINAEYGEYWFVTMLLRANMRHGKKRMKDKKMDCANCYTIVHLKECFKTHSDMLL